MPDLYANEEKGLEVLAQVKFFLPGTGWTWYASEGAPVDENGFFDTDKEKVDFFFFGLVVGQEIEVGYFALSELERIKSPLGLPVERDLDFEPQSLKALKDWHKQ